MKTVAHIAATHVCVAFSSRVKSLQSFLSRKLNGGLMWETVYHCKRGLSKILSAAEEWGRITENVAQKSLLGHSSPEITREIYLHAIPEEQRRAVESVERIVFGSEWTQVHAPAYSSSTRVN
ncbi:MAG: hypothetical protein WCA15_11450 [Candidatus Acidiferrales bacterium]